MRRLDAIPTGELSDELLELSETAHRLSLYITRPNEVLPTDFPTRQIEDICHALSKLRFGTVGGCKEPLEYARNKLPAIRSQYIHRRSSVVHDDAAQRVYRDSLIDRAVADLLVCITSSLDAYRRARPADILDDDTYRDMSYRPPNSAAVSSALAKSHGVAKNIATAQTSANELLTDDDVNSLVLRRQLNDADTLNQLTRAELRDDIAARWLRKLTNTLRHAPSALRATAKLIKISKFVGEKIADRWHQFEDAIEKGISQAVDGLCDDLDSVADEIETRYGLVNTENPNQIPAFNLTSVVKDLIGGKRPSNLIIPYITSITSNEDISDLSAFSCLKNLQILDLEDADIGDITPLASLTNLRQLEIGSTTCTHLAPLSNLRKLEKLSLISDTVTDISAISHLERLNELSFYCINVKDLSSISNLINLKSLIIMSTSADSVTFLERLSNLQNLVVGTFPITDSSPLCSLAKVENLSIHNLMEDRLLNISKLTSLLTLRIDEGSIKNIEGLGDLHSLRSLSLTSLPLNSTDHLAECTNIRSITLDNSTVESIDFARNLKNLGYLSISRTSVSDLTPLSNCSSLTNLDIQGTKITDLTPIYDIPGLRLLNIRNTRIENVGPLSERDGLVIYRNS